MKMMLEKEKYSSILGNLQPGCIFFLPLLWWDLAAAATESQQVHLSES